MSRKARSSFSRDFALEESQINLTPLIDVVFVVLIIFILIAPMLELDRVHLAQASAKDTKEMAMVQEKSGMTIHVHEDNTIWLNGKEMTSGQLLMFLKQARRQHPERIPQLFQDKKAHFGTYQTIKNAVEEAGFEELDVVLQPG